MFQLTVGDILRIDIDEIEAMLCDHALIRDTASAITGEEDYSDYLVSI